MRRFIKFLLVLLTTFDSFSNDSEKANNLIVNLYERYEDSNLDSTDMVLDHNNINAKIYYCIGDFSSVMGSEINFSKSKYICGIRYSKGLRKLDFKQNEKYDRYFVYPEDEEFSEIVFNGGIHINLSFIQLEIKSGLSLISLKLKGDLDKYEKEIFKFENSFGGIKYKDSIIVINEIYHQTRDNFLSFPIDFSLSYTPFKNFGFGFKYCLNFNKIEVLEYYGISLIIGNFRY